MKKIHLKNSATYKNKRNNKKKLLTGTFLIILIIFIGLTLATLLKSPLLRLQHIQVAVKANYWSKEFLKSVQEKIEEEMKPFKGQSTLKVNLKEVAQLVQSDLRVYHVQVQRRLPNRLELNIKLHEPLALLMAPNGHLLPVSRDASLLPPVAEREKVDFPILRGQNFHQRKELRIQALQILEKLLAQNQGTHNISEVRFDKKFGYILYLLPHGTIVRLGHNYFSEKIKRVKKVIRYLENQNIAYSTIDVRFTKKVVVKPRRQI